MIRFLLSLFSLLCCATALEAQAWQADKLSVALQTELQAQPGQPQHIQILLKDRVDPALVEARYRRMNMSLSERSAALINALRQKAANTQNPVVKTLESLPGIPPESIATFWIANLIFCQASPAAIAELSRDSRVEWIDLDWEVKVLDAVESCPAPPVPDGREPGLDAIGAPFMWALGYTGYGTKVLVVDSGNDPQHPAMRQNFAYNYLPLEQAWANGEQPYFCSDHGTHVGGTIVGLDRATNDTIGVAFGALWQSSAAHFADCEGEARARDFVQLFEWAMDPDGNPATIDDRPDVINNSWSRNLPTNEDCGDPITRAIVDAVYATGIAVVFSASNEGPDDATIGNPPMENWDTLRMFSVGALNGHSSSLLVADFSSRGPTVCGGEGALAIKPEVSAPGVNVRSCSFDGSYQEKSGTSMAAPHVSGALLLLKEAFPYLEGEMLMRALYESSIDLGPAGEDNQYGRGMIYLPNAYQWLLDRGYVPVPPVSSANDVSLLRVTPLKRSCLNTLESEIAIENNGLDTLNSLQAAVSLAGTADTFSWTLQLSPGEMAALPLPTLVASTGRKELEVSLLQANGAPDTRRFDNRIKQQVEIFDD
ncbi:MAG: S8 family serine peptidase, partial [Bacteroidetes bacterium]|nr:S8 family serine peptidase [Bacteroidota bacterium]